MLTLYTGVRNPIDIDFKGYVGELANIKVYFVEKAGSPQIETFTDITAELSLFERHGPPPGSVTWGGYAGYWSVADPKQGWLLGILTPGGSGDPIYFDESVMVLPLLMQLEKLYIATYGNNQWDEPNQRESWFHPDTDLAAGGFNETTVGGVTTRTRF